MCPDAPATSSPQSRPTRRVLSPLPPVPAQRPQSPTPSTGDNSDPHQIQNSKRKAHPMKTHQAPQNGAPNPEGGGAKSIASATHPVVVDAQRDRESEGNHLNAEYCRRLRHYQSRLRQLSVVWFSLLCAPGAFGATFRWSATLNRIYVENGGEATLSDIKAALPSAPLDLVDAANKIWLLRADLFIQDGSTLNLHGAMAEGDVNELRLQSVNSTTPCNCVVSITADWGALSIDSTKITSWDTMTGGPDTNYLVNGRDTVAG